MGCLKARFGWTWWVRYESVIVVIVGKEEGSVESKERIYIKLL